MKIFSKILTLVKEKKSKQVETILITEKQCPHCTSRGMFVFKDSSIQKSSHGDKNEKLK